MTTNHACWETQLGPALSAYRNTVSAATGYTPFQALYGRKAHILKTLAQTSGHSDGVLGDDPIVVLACIWMGVWTALREERETNKARQKKKRTSQTTGRRRFCYCASAQGEARISTLLGRQMGGHSVTRPSLLDPSPTHWLGKSYSPRETTAGSLKRRLGSCATD